MVPMILRWSVIALSSACVAGNALFEPRAATCPCYTYTQTIIPPCVSPTAKGGSPCPSVFNCPLITAKTTYIPPPTATCSPYSTTTTVGHCPTNCQQEESSACADPTVTKSGCYTATVTTYSPKPGIACPDICTARKDKRCLVYKTVTEPPADCHCPTTPTKTVATHCPQCGGCSTSTVFVKPTS